MRRWQTAEKRNAEYRGSGGGGGDAARMLDASNGTALHGRKRISDLNGNAEGTSFRFMPT